MGYSVGISKNKYALDLHIKITSKIKATGWYTHEMSNESKQPIYNRIPLFVAAT